MNLKGYTQHCLLLGCLLFVAGCAGLNDALQNVNESLQNADAAINKRRTDRDNPLNGLTFSVRSTYLQPDLSRPQAERILCDNLGTWDWHQNKKFGIVGGGFRFLIVFVPELQKRESRSELLPVGLLFESLDDSGWSYQVSHRIVDRTVNLNKTIRYYYHYETEQGHVAFSDVKWLKVLKPRTTGFSGQFTDPTRFIELDDAAKNCLIRFSDSGDGTDSQLNQIVSAFYVLCPNAN